MASPRRRGRMRERALLLTLLVLVVVWNLLPPPAAAVETIYSRGVYRWLAAVLVPLTDLTDLAVGALALVLLVPALLLLATWRWVRGRRRGVSRWRLGLGGAKWLALGALSGYLVFLLVWGAGYRRQPIEQRLSLDTRPVDPREIHQAVESLLDAIQRDLPAAIERDEARALAALRDSVGALVAEWDGAPPTLPRRIKRLPAGLLLAFGTAGVTSPFSLEAHVDPALPGASFLAVAAHELAHVAGINGEADADMTALIAGLRCEDPYGRYALALSFFEKFARALPAGEARRARQRLPAPARRDLEEARRATARHRIEALARTQRRVYDGYLRSQGVEAGVKDYARGLELLIRARRRGLVSLDPGKNPGGDGREEPGEEP